MTCWKKKIAATTDRVQADKLRNLRGRTAVSNAKLVYPAFKEIFGSQRFKALEMRGAKLQRPLWGSTGTTNPTYSDLLYVDTLVGSHTVNTVPPKTYTAILEHGKPALTIEADLDGARATLNELAAAGINLNVALQKLEDDGVSVFEKSFDGLHKNVLDKRNAFAEIEV